MTKVLQRYSLIRLEGSKMRIVKLAYAQKWTLKDHLIPQKRIKSRLIPNKRHWN